MIRVLIADDHAIVRKGLKQLITEEYPTAKIGEVGNAESLLTEILKDEWDLVICDMNMPGRSGLDALNQIKQTNLKLPVLILSMYPEDQYALRVLKAGASGYLAKETVHEELPKAIRTALSGRRYITQSVAEKLAESFLVDFGKPLHELLSDREFDVFKLLATGKSVSEIAEQLSLSSTTISTYRSRILEKMNMKTNAELVRYAIENKII
ncbi:MAG: response regulator transcription factor [Bacteroidetes bacterium]|nr:response regulator transcription factor [Bacteroidota bacterium]MBS1931857.1 response regulator transcription factor [Bacteroidota bacterium]